MYDVDINSSPAFDPGFASTPFDNEEMLPKNGREKVGGEKKNQYAKDITHVHRCEIEMRV